MKKRKLKKGVKRFFIFLIVIALVGGYTYFRYNKAMNKSITKFEVEGLDIDYKFLTKNKYSRPGTKLKRVKGVVVHYTANPGSTAINNRNYFENLKDTHLTYASSHFVIGLQGEIIQCIPLNEWAYASNNRNKDTISIECCHPTSNGSFNEATYNSLVKLVQALIDTYYLDVDDVIRHYDVTGKLCPLYFVNNPSEWTKFKKKLTSKSWFIF